jgi:2-amino-4-hydroxy-6-hydroxymethyldihydropteridine diphosphokinase
VKRILRDLAAAYVGLGGNLGDVEKTLRTALERLDALPATRVLRVSSLYRTAPVGVVEQPDFLNAAAAVETELEPERFLAELLALEEAFGRRRAQRWGPRTLDLDLLLWGERVLRSPALELPHPRMHERAFVLAPLAEIAGGAQHPTLGRTVAELLQALGPFRGVDRLVRPEWPGRGEWRT